MMASAPTNQAERPDVIASDAVSVANRIVVTAPGQKFKSIGAGPTKLPALGCAVGEILLTAWAPVLVAMMS
jgi:hypothetical protein